MKFFGVSLFSFLFFAAIAQHSDPEQKTMNAFARKGVSGQWIKLEDGITHYEMKGKPTKGVIVLVHGFSVPYFIWDGFFESLVNNGFQVIRYDQYGRGYSDRLLQPYTANVYTKQLKGLIKGVHISSPITLIGVSFGGIVTANFTLAYPELVNKLILIDPIAATENNTMSESSMDQWMMENSDQRAIGQLEDFKYPKQFPQWVRKYKVQMNYKGTRQALVSTLYHYDSITYLNRYKKLQALKKPIMLIWGTEDRAVPFNYSDSIKSLLDVKFLPVPDAAHLPHLEKPTIVINAILPFITSH